MYWCWISADVLDVCRDAGVGVFWDKEIKSWWAHDVCYQADCKCSGIGMHPTVQDLSSNHFTEGLWDNKMNYGSECRKWHIDDSWPWCFVGFDSICSDRHPEDRKSHRSMEKEVPRELEGTTWQWRSHLPCQV